MVKHTTALLQRAAPAPPRSHKPARFPTRLAQHQKSPFLSRANITRSPALRSRLHSTNTNRFLASRSQLDVIAELPEEDDEHIQALHSPDKPREQHRYLDSWHSEDSRAGPSRAHGRDDDVDMLGWDDETTLVAMLQESPEEDEEEQLMALVDQLKGPMAAQGTALKQYLKDTLIPAISNIKATHDQLDGKVDVAFGAGILTFDEVCKKVERIALRDEDELKTARADSQRIIAETLEQLQQAYERRKELWTSFEDDFNGCANRATASLEALSTDVEQTISLLEKKSKILDKDSGSAANQKMLRGLLEKL